jgi:hypothetical protein
VTVYTVEVETVVEVHNRLSTCRLTFSNEVVIGAFPKVLVP